MKLLITGCGRSGTAYASTVLVSIGFQVLHEIEGEHGTVDWHAVGWPSERLQPYTTVLHQVGHPLRVIASWFTVSDSSWDYVAGVLDLSGSKLRKTMQYWLEWNHRAEALASHTYRVEDFWLVVPQLLPALPWEVGKVSEVPSLVNSRESYPSYFRGLTWETLRREDSRLASQIEAKARQYGYTEF